MISISALRILHQHARMLHVTAELPELGRVTFRVTAVGTKLSGTRMDTGEIVSDVSPEWVVSTTAL